MLRIQTKDWLFHIINEPKDMSADVYTHLLNLVEQANGEKSSIVIYKIAPIIGYDSVPEIDWSNVIEWLVNIRVCWSILDQINGLDEIGL